MQDRSREMHQVHNFAKFHQFLHKLTRGTRKPVSR